MNQTSELSFVVPVLPAAGICAGSDRRTIVAVPRSITSRIISRTMKATFESSTAAASAGCAVHTVWPPRSSMRDMNCGCVTVPSAANAL